MCEVVTFFDLESELLQNYYRGAQKKQRKAGSRISSWRSFSFKSCCYVKKRGRKHPHSEIMKWGFTDFKRTPIINARAETVVEEKDLSSTIFAKSLCFPNEWLL